MPLLFSLCSCVSFDYDTDRQINEFTYFDVEEKHISWEELYSINEINYFVYIYQINCLHCNEIKQDILTISLSNLLPIYFIHYDDSVPLCGTDSGACIYGTPTLLKISNYEITKKATGSEEVKKTLIFELGEHFKNILFKIINIAL